MDGAALIYIGVDLLTLGPGVANWPRIIGSPDPDH